MSNNVYISGNKLLDYLNEGEHSQDEIRLKVLKMICDALDPLGYMRAMCPHWEIWEWQDAPDDIKQSAGYSSMTGSIVARYPRDLFGYGEPVVYKGTNDEESFVQYLRQWTKDAGVEP